MKYGNPTDAQLNAAFALHVFGAKEIDGDMMRMDDAEMNGEKFEAWLKIPDFTKSAGAVLPWLEKMPTVHIHWDGKFYKVHVSDRIYPYGLDERFPKAAVIALLRAHRVEVEWIAAK